MGSKLQPWPCKDPNNFSQLILDHSKSEECLSDSSPGAERECKLMHIIKKMSSVTNQPTHDRPVAPSDQVTTPEVKNTKEKVRQKRVVFDDLATLERTPKHPRASASPDTYLLNI